ncbi:tyrosine-type recombinase/integrase [Bradyrhizobium betae]|uniref:tyrosine-type recombinase/integrase n=1 Tax=Bradyrhizobium betae TaxID=244734 RepID=UPI003D667C3A
MYAISQPYVVSLYSLQGQRKYLTGPERTLFIAAAMSCPRPELRSFCLVLAYTGCRISEALKLVAANIETTETSIALRSLKKRKKVGIVRQVPVPAALIDEVKIVHDLSVPGRRLWTWSRSRAWQLVKAIMAQAGICPGLHATPKGLRHGFGVHAIRSGIPLNLVQRWMGHASMTTTAIYLQVIGAEEREIAERMWQ